MVGRARSRRLRGKVSWGSRIPAGETWRRLRALRAEYGTQANVARALGFRDRHVQCRGLVITVRNFVKILTLYRASTGLDLDDAVD